jgi:hypothetical protein
MLFFVILQAIFSVAIFSPDIHSTDSETSLHSSSSSRIGTEPESGLHLRSEHVVPGESFEHDHRLANLIPDLLNKNRGTSIKEKQQIVQPRSIPQSLAERVLVCVLPQGTQLANGLRHLSTCSIIADATGRRLLLDPTLSMSAEFFRCESRYFDQIDDN